jgi:hypothetical protein
LKPSYFRQAVKNLQEVEEGTHRKIQKELFDFASDGEPEETMEFEAAE